MKLLVIRHAIAEDKDVWARSGASDDDRPLTADGQAKMARNAAGLHSIISRIDLLATSPLVRARQTAEIVRAEYDLADVETTETLIASRPLKQFTGWLGERAEHETVAVVGHEPHLAELVTWLLTGDEDPKIELKKGAACLLEFEDRPSASGGRLCWLVQPSQLRALRGD